MKIWSVLALLLLSHVAFAAEKPDGQFKVQEKSDRLSISLNNQPIADFVFRDEKILRPYFANVRLPSGRQVTRNHPPQPLDAADHAEMHPGVWLGFGDISGSDFWRNKGRIEHLEFTQRPVEQPGRLTFATKSRLVSPAGQALCNMNSRFQLVSRSSGWLLAWDSEFRSDEGDFSFGDQEEMGFGARVATPLTEKSGGSITNSSGLKTAAATWGKAADWCDYSGTIGDQPAGITLMAAKSNFRQSWWHNRDYGVFVANPFGRAAMKQGEKSTITVRKGESLKLSFGACFHEGKGYSPAAAFADFEMRNDPAGQ